MCLGNLFPGQPGYQILSQRLMAGASFVYTFFFFSLQGCRLVCTDVDKKRWRGEEKYIHCMVRKNTVKDGVGVNLMLSTPREL